MLLSSLPECALFLVAMCVFAWIVRRPIYCNTIMLFALRWNREWGRCLVAVEAVEAFWIASHGDSLVTEVFTSASVVSLSVAVQVRVDGETRRVE